MIVTKTQVKVVLGHKILKNSCPKAEVGLELHIYLILMNVVFISLHPLYLF